MLKIRDDVWLGKLYNFGFVKYEGNCYIYSYKDKHRLIVDGKSRNIYLLSPYYRKHLDKLCDKLCEKNLVEKVEE